MSEKIFIYFDHGRFSTFESGIQDLCSRANGVINAWHKTQSWHTVETEADALELLSDPAGRLDAVIIENVGMNVGKVQPNAQKLADLFNVDRTAFLEYVTAKAKFTIDRLKANGKFIQWQGRAFVVNAEAVEAEKVKFTVYAETERQKLIFRHYETLRDMLALHGKLGLISTPEMQKVCEALQLAYIDNRPMINEIRLSQLIYR